ncbi:MAG: pyruvate kinase [Gemmatimonadota bacterium]|nr:MAG: pyruvate kinase [Gemmatimonadota bacterium]
MDTGKRAFLKTKVICTVGPASADPGTLAALCDAGMDVARLNMSHTGHEEARLAARRIRECAASSDRPIAIMVDLQGPKIRIGRLDGPRMLASGDVVGLAPADRAAGEELPVSYPDLARDLRPDDRVLLSDGQIELRVREVAPPRVITEVVLGGEVSSGKGVNLPGVRVSAPSLTEKDLADLEVALEIEAEYVALSFARSAENVLDLRERVPEVVSVVTKIEKDSALEELEAILGASDAVIVARGDLGTELPFEQVPLAQKRIVRRANARYRPVVIATELLESMIERPRPTRAEVSDIANAILDGADAVLLSAETAVGRYPVGSVRALVRVLREVESEGPLLKGGPLYDVPAASASEAPVSTEVAVACATVEAVRAIGAPAIITYTNSGHTARVVSSRRPPVPILAVTSSARVQRQLAMVWGVLPVLCRESLSEDNMRAVARAELLRTGLAGPGDRVVVTAGLPFHVRGTTNMVRIETI